MGRLAGLALLAAAAAAPVQAGELRSAAALAARRADVAERGGSAETEAAVAAALEWLVAHQAEDGSWRPETWPERCAEAGGCEGPGTNAGVEAYAPGVTGLALLALLAGPEAGGPHAGSIRRALAWLVALQAEDGGLLFADLEKGSYNHAIATAALCEALALTGDAELREPAERAVALCLKAQNPNLAWKYGARSGRNDTSVTAWMTLALRHAELAGIAVPPETLGGARNWFWRVTDSKGDVGYETPGDGSSIFAANDGRYETVPVMTAAAVFARRAIGDPADHEAVVKGVDLLTAAAEARPRWAERRHHFYYWFWGSHALQQAAGAREREDWNRALVAALVPAQREDGCAAGSWDPLGPWCLAGGRVYATALAALALEAYYRYPDFPERDFSREGVAERRAALEEAAAERAEVAAELAELDAAGEALAAARRGRDRYQVLRPVLSAARDRRDVLAERGRAVLAALPDAVVDRLLGDLRRGPRYARRDVARALAFVRPRPAVVEALVAALEDDELSVRAAAAEGLGGLGEAAAEAAPALEALQDDPEFSVRSAARRALEAIRGEGS